MTIWLALPATLQQEFELKFVLGIGMGRGGSSDRRVDTFHLPFALCQKDGGLVTGSA